MTTYQAKTMGKGDKTIHRYFPSIRYPGLLHRLCQPRGRLWEPITLRFKPSNETNGWRRNCPTCDKVQATYDANPLHYEAGLKP